ncbi:MAG TPA: ABC transporter permease [Bryobacteraceae bacterium]|jgi:predicted permease|nr:ABC transporter permease [Bryobacteraceae bacterium]
MHFNLEEAFEPMLNDLQYAIRQLVKSPAFTVVAVLTIALGIGANTAIFSVVNGVLINPLPYPNPHRIVVLYEELPDFKDGSISYPNFLDWQRMNDSFSALAAYRPAEYNLLGKDQPEHLHGEMISAGFFEILGVHPVVGRTFNKQDDRRGTAPAVMISEGLWRRDFGATPNIIGQRLVLDGIGRTVVGVVPSRFRLRVENFQDGPALNDIYTPIGEYNDPGFYADRGSGWGMKAIGRLKPGVTFELTREDMDRVSRELTARYPNTDSNEKANLVPLKQAMVGDMRGPLLILLGAVFFVLLISCVNVSNLLLARSTAREREFAIRIAVGGGQWRITRQLLTESVLLALVGGGMGLLLAQFGTAAALAAVPHTVPRAEEIGLDFRVFLFTTVTSILAGALFGLAPALKLRNANLAGALKEVGRSITGSRHRTQRLFVIAEVALALVLLVGAGLMVRTLFALWRLDPGFNPRSVISFSIAPQPSLIDESPAAIRAFFRQVHDQLASSPGVKAVSLSLASSPMEDDYDWHIWFAGRPKPAHPGQLPMSLVYVVEPDYLKTFQISLKRGRFFTGNDNEQSSPVAVIDQSLAGRYFPGQDPIGQYLDLDNDPKEPAKRPKPRIVGIVGHVNQWGLDDTARPLHAQIYLPLDQMPNKDFTSLAQGVQAFVRGNGSHMPDFEMLRQRLQSLNHEVVVYGNQSMERVVLDSIANKRFTMKLLAVFAGLALLLASIGIYGVLSYLVGQRTRDIGIRIALGAERRDVLRMILTDGAWMTLVGVGIGIAAALSLTQLMSGMLFGVRPTDVVTFIFVVLTLCFIAMIACYVPARRAMKIDPLIALRDE